jgi:hypothetical protein
MGMIPAYPMGGAVSSAPGSGDRKGAARSRSRVASALCVTHCNRVVGRIGFSSALRVSCSRRAGELREAAAEITNTRARC